MSLPLKKIIDIVETEKSAFKVLTDLLHEIKDLSYEKMVTTKGVTSSSLKELTILCAIYLQTDESLANTLRNIVVSLDILNSAIKPASALMQEPSKKRKVDPESLVIGQKIIINFLKQCLEIRSLINPEIIWRFTTSKRKIKDQIILRSGLTLEEVTQLLDITDDTVNIGIENWYYLVQQNTCKNYLQSFVNKLKMERWTLFSELWRSVQVNSDTYRNYIFIKDKEQYLSWKTTSYIMEIDNFKLLFSPQAGYKICYTCNSGYMGHHPQHICENNMKHNKV